MNFETAVTINAPAERVWAVLTDVERWPEWTASVTSAELLEPGPLQPGSRVRIQQPRLAEAVYHVEEFTDRASFTWTATRPGITTTAGHHLSTENGTTRVRLTVSQRGPLAWTVGLLLSGTIRRYLQMEATGLRTRCEQPAR
jgi:uncharacterized membrane protein